LARLRVDATSARQVATVAGALPAQLSAAQRGKTDDGGGRQFGNCGPKSVTSGHNG